MKSTLKKIEKQTLAGVPGTYNSFFFRYKKYILPVVIAIVLGASIVVSAFNLFGTYSFEVDKPTFYFFLSGLTEDSIIRFCASRENITEEEVRAIVNIRVVNKEREKKACIHYYGLDEQERIKSIIVDKNNHVVVVRSSGAYWDLFDDLRNYGILEEP